MTHATLTAPRTYAQWRIELLAVAQVYGVKSARWHETLTAAYKDISFRVWALADDVIAALGSVR